MNEGKGRAYDPRDAPYLDYSLATTSYPTPPSSLGNLTPFSSDDDRAVSVSEASFQSSLEGTVEDVGRYLKEGCTQTKVHDADAGTENAVQVIGELVELARDLLAETSASQGFKRVREYESMICDRIDSGPIARFMDVATLNALQCYFDQNECEGCQDVSAPDESVSVLDAVLVKGEADSSVQESLEVPLQSARRDTSPNIGSDIGRPVASTASTSAQVTQTSAQVGAMNGEHDENATDEKTQRSRAAKTVKSKHDLFGHQLKTYDALLVNFGPKAADSQPPQKQAVPTSNAQAMTHIMSSSHEASLGSQVAHSQQPRQQAMSTANAYVIDHTESSIHATPSTRPNPSRRRAADENWLSKVLRSNTNSHQARILPFPHFGVNQIAHDLDEVMQRMYGWNIKIQEDLRPSVSSSRKLSELDNDWKTYAKDTAEILADFQMLDRHFREMVRWAEDQPQSASASMSSNAADTADLGSPIPAPSRRTSPSASSTSRSSEIPPFIFQAGEDGPSTAEAGTRDNSVSTSRRAMDGGPQRAERIPQGTQHGLGVRRFWDQTR